MEGDDPSDLGNETSNMSLRCLFIQLLFLGRRGVHKENPIPMPLSISLMLPGCLEQILLHNCFSSLGTTNSPMKGAGATSIEEPALTYT